MSELNWAGNVDYGTTTLHRPTSLPQLQDLVQRSERLRVVGTRHSFSEIVRTDGDLVSLEDLPRTIDVDAADRTATVTGTVPYGPLGAELHAAGFALPNLGSLPHIAVAGACATGTHGSGVANRALATAVRSVDLVLADGSLRTLSRGDAAFGGAVVNLGALGVVVRLTFDLVPTFDVRQDVYDDADVPPADLLDALGEAYSVSLFSDLRSDRFRTSWLKRRDDAGLVAARPTWRGGTLARSARHPVPGQPSEGTTLQSVVGPWHERLPHFRLDVPPSSRGDELQSEFLVPREHGAAAWAAMLSLRERLAPLVQVVELRTVASDDLWLSMAQGRDSVALHVTWVPDWPAVREVLGALEPLLRPFGARPHWGKLFVTPAEQVRALYPHLDDFARLAADLDPDGCFRNAFVDTYVPRR